MTNIYKGYNTGIMYKTESTYGTAVTVDTAIEGKVTAFAGNWTNNFFREQGLGEGRNATFTGFGAFDAGGTIEWIPSRMSFLEYVIGTKSGDGSSGTPFLLTEADSLSSFTMQAFNDATADMVDTYEGCMLNNVTLTLAEGDLLRASADWVAETVRTNTAGVAFSADTTDPWNFAQGVLKWGATPSTEAYVTNGSITISNNLFVYRALGSRFIQEPTTGLRRYDFNITVKANSDVLGTLQQDMMGQADTPHEGKSSASPTSSLELQLYFEGVTNQKLYLQLDEASIESIGKPVDLGGGIIELSLTGIAKEGLGNIPIKWQTSA